MNPRTNTTQPTQQFHLTACRVGDWVLAGAVPEWKTDRVKQIFTPPNQVLAGMFGSSIQAPKDWVFMGGLLHPGALHRGSDLAA